MEIPKELAGSVIALLVAHVAGGIAWMFRLGARMTRAEDRMATMIGSHESNERRISRVEESHASHGNRLTAIETKIGNVESLVNEVRDQQREVLSILRDRR